MEFFHLLNRGVDKRNIVLDEQDRLRFVHSLFVFNDAKLVDPNHATPFWHEPNDEREKLVSIHAWCLMKNHYHLLVSPIDNDITRVSTFMKKLNMGYSKYFNEKNKRTGALWQGKYRKIRIENEAHFLHIPYYIHLNPLDYRFPEWRHGSLKNVRVALKYLEKYRWSSHLDYLGRINFPLIIDRETCSELLGSATKYEKSIAGMVSDNTIASQSFRIE